MNGFATRSRRWRGRACSRVTGRQVQGNFAIEDRAHTFPKLVGGEVSCMAAEDGLYISKRMAMRVCKRISMASITSQVSPPRDRLSAFPPSKSHARSTSCAGLTRLSDTLCERCSRASSRRVTSPILIDLYDGADRL